MEAAVEVFWRLGYDGASLDDLTKAMGLNRPSLYRAFGDKKTLYLKALQHYSETTGSNAMQAFVSEPEISAAVEKMLSVSLECQIRGDDMALGCLLANCAPTTLRSVPESQSMLLDVLEASQNRFADRFMQEIARGNLPTGFPARERAVLLMDFVQSQAYRARIGQDAENLRASIGPKVAAVLAL